MRFTLDDFAMFAKANEVCDYLNRKLDSLTDTTSESDNWFDNFCRDFVFEKWLAGEYEDAPETVHYVERKAVGE